MNQQQLPAMPKATTPPLSYYAVSTPRNKYDYLCIAQARSSQHAMKIARNNGLKLPKGSTAVDIGQRGYLHLLRRAFR